MATDKSITAKVGAVPDKQFRFKFLNGSTKGQEALVSRDVFFIGRSGNNNLVLDDRSVSRKQAVLNFVDDKFILSDLNSFKGTVVNGKKVHEIELKNGDRVKMGGILLEFLEGEREIFVRRKRGVKWFFLFLLIVAVAVGTYLFTRPKTGIDAELMRQIEFNYSQGIRAYNVDKDVETATKYWQMVIELDKKNETIQSRKARLLLNELKE